MFINITIAFFLIFIGHETRKIEIENKNIIEQIHSVNESININQIEFVLHNDIEYLKKLYLIYQGSLIKSQNSKIIKLSDLSNFKNKEIYQVNFE
tara:strand:- start:171 stop:455 length:285 start_codon:yes stop_codon:yes gene_type:complete